MIKLPQKKRDNLDHGTHTVDGSEIRRSPSGMYKTRRLNSLPTGLSAFLNHQQYVPLYVPFKTLPKTLEDLHFSWSNASSTYPPQKKTAGLIYRA